MKVTNYIDLCIIVPVISNCDSVSLQNISVTLTFKKGMSSWTRQNVVMRWTFVSRYFKIPQCMTKLQSGHDCCVSGDTRADRETWALAATHCLYVEDICAKLFLILPCIIKLQSGNDCVFQTRENEYLPIIWVTLNLKVGTWILLSTCRLGGIHLCLVVLKSFYVWHSYSPYTIVCTYLLYLHKCETSKW
jgi:hypothetical protein